MKDSRPLPVMISPEDVAEDLIKLAETDLPKALEIREQQRQIENKKLKSR